jgi:hypothetical protein
MFSSLGRHTAGTATCRCFTSSSATRERRARAGRDCRRPEGRDGSSQLQLQRPRKRSKSDARRLTVTRKVLRQESDEVVGLGMGLKVPLHPVTRAAERSSGCLRTATSEIGIAVSFAPHTSQPSTLAHSELPALLWTCERAPLSVKRSRCGRNVGPSGCRLNTETAAHASEQT